MMFSERYKDLIKTEKEVNAQFNGNAYIENNVIEKIDIVITGHFGNTVSVDMLCDMVCPLGFYNSTQNVGYILRALIEIFDKEDDDHVSFKALEGTPIRIIYNGKFGGRAVAIGHFMKDRFVVVEELMQLKD